MKRTILGSAAISTFLIAAPLTTAFAYKAPLPVASWTGFYIGGDLGGAWTSNTANWSAVVAPGFGALPVTAKDGGSGFLGGFHAGYNYQFAPTWVAGLEGDWMWTRAAGSSSGPYYESGPPFAPVATSAITMSSKLDWVSSLRGRLGYLVTPNLLAYGTGGVAWAKIDYAGTASQPGGVPPYFASAATSPTETGFAFGGGVEWAMTKNWLVRAEYLYYRFNNSPTVFAPAANYPNSPSTFSWSSTNVGVARGGLSYKF